MKNIKLLLVFDILLSALPVVAQKTKVTKQPNIVFIISDDHRWDALGAAGNKEIKTPVLDKLAREGIYFRQAIIYVSMCAPSRAVLLTGLSPHQNGYYANNFVRDDLQWADRFTVPTMPGLLQKAGYQTVLVGKWHLVTDPWLTGFSDVRTWLPDGASSYIDSRLAKGNSRKKEKITGFTNGIFTDDAITFLSSGAAKEKPFLLWFASTIPHSPFKPNPSHFEHMYEEEKDHDIIPPAFPSHHTVALGQEGTVGDSVAPKMINYYQSVSHLDSLVGRITATLEKEGLAENTIVIFMGDNGLMAGSRNIKGKVVPWEESLRVPLIIKAPKLATIKGVSNVPVSSLDISATILSMAGISVPKEWSGRNLMPVLKGSKTHGINYALSQWADTQGQFRHYTHRLVRTPKYKLIRWDKPYKPDEMYDLVADPHETKNIINEPSIRTERDKLLGWLFAGMKRTNDPALYWPKKNGNKGSSEDEAAELQMRSGLNDKTPVVIDTKIYDLYVGKYEFATRQVNSITKEGDKLFLQGDFGPKAELIAKSENVFVHKTLAVRITFIKNADGTVTGLIRRNSLSDEFRTIDMRARKIE
jgi:N-acetylglucosamine-6-sulfatase